MNLFDEDLSGERDQTIIAVADGNMVIGVAQMKPLTGGRVKLRQMGVLDSY